MVFSFFEDSHFIVSDNLVINTRWSGNTDKGAWK